MVVADMEEVAVAEAEAAAVEVGVEWLPAVVFPVAVTAQW
jgi:hypothetical protein